MTSQDAKRPPRGGAPVSAAALRWGVVALVVVIALVAWLATRGGGSGSSGPPPQFLSQAELIQAAKGASPPIYWAGAAVNAEYELREVEGGHQVLYVPAGEHSEAASTRALTVGSYPLADPEAEIEAIAERPGAIVRHASDGREVVSSRRDLSSVYFVAPEGEVEIEVYAPAPGRALRLALSGRVRPVR
ncbi:MAG TPA: hypothetical protein VHU86_02420 [Solirubrobacterales bacterium]|jgi:hypothetical protein|nr:hypothetical protein [Solirubrobacterales bacterium]